MRTQINSAVQNSELIKLIPGIGEVLFKHQLRFDPEKGKVSSNLALLAFHNIKERPPLKGLQDTISKFLLPILENLLNSKAKKEELH